MLKKFMRVEAEDFAIALIPAALLLLWARVCGVV
jgi:hypothetical protein